MVLKENLYKQTLFYYDAMIYFMTLRQNINFKDELFEKSKVQRISGKNEFISKTCLPRLLI